jgi:membrane associated rhomboid family serine protease
MAALETALQILVGLGILFGAGLAHRLDSSDVGWIGRLRRRFLLGIPWGTLTALVIVFAVYFGLQGGWAHPYDPVTIPYISWSYLYPLGWLTAAFAHSGFGHLTGNVIGTILLAPIAEYAWGHYPRRRGTASFSSLGTNPYVRAFLAFPLAVVLVGLATAVFHWGPLIGFSGVVYAFAGFALVWFPITTVVALSAQGAVSTTYLALRDPVITSSPGTSFGTPWWAGVAVEGHLFGIIVGVVLGVLYLRRSEESAPSSTRLWVATVLAGFSLTLWALWWYGPGNSFELFRGPGVLLVIVLATVVTAAAAASTRDLLPRIGPLEGLKSGITRRRTATMILVLALTTMGLIAIPVNFTTVEAGTPPSGAVEVRDYAVYYAEGIRNQNVPAIDFPVLGAATNVTTSGVIVVNRDRHLWTREVSTARLAFNGGATVRVGGPTWSETVGVRREGWVPRGGSAVYTVSLRGPDGEWRQTFASEASQASPTIAGRNVSVAVDEEAFVLVVSRNGSALDQVAIPAVNESVRAAGLQFRRIADRVVVTADGTRITIATREEYN